MTRPRRALVESVLLVLTPGRCLHLSPCSLADPSLRVLSWPLLSAQFQFHLVTAPDGVPVHLDLPRQPLTINPPRWLPSQSIPIAHDLISHPTRPRRRPKFRCPACEHGCSRLYLPDDRERFTCRQCCGLVHRSWVQRWHTVIPTPTPNCVGTVPPLTILRAYEVWERWLTEGKGRHREGYDFATAKDRPHKCPKWKKFRGRPKKLTLTAKDIDLLKGKLFAGMTQGQIAAEMGLSRQTLNRYIVETCRLQVSRGDCKGVRGKVDARKRRRSGSNLLRNLPR